MRLIEDDKCIFSDYVICIDGRCISCEYFLRKIHKTIIPTSVQLSIWDVIRDDKEKTNKNSR